MALTEKTGVFSPGRAKISEKTLRTDKWWLQPLITVSVLLSFIVYTTFRVFQGKYYYHAPLISPFYSPCLSKSCVAGSSLLGQPFGIVKLLGVTLPPAIWILVFPLGFRMTCYYYRKAYYRSFWQSPPACAVAEPHKKYTGETKPPLIVSNGHRWFFFIGLIFNFILTADAILAFRNDKLQWGHVSLGTLVLVLNATCLWLYSLSCHTCRHTIGGRLRHFSKHPVRYKAWTVVSKLNLKHQNFAWISLVVVALSDLYVALVSSGAIHNPYLF
jgi:hypothetical protein